MLFIERKDCLMIKRGFTLAEVLITLMIIGVVAALTTPALLSNVGNAKIGPTLGKVVSSMENAHEMMMHEENISSLSSIASADLSLWTDKEDNSKYMENYDSAIEKYMAVLATYIAGSSYSKITMPSSYKYDGTVIPGGGGEALIFHFSNNVDIGFMDYKKQGDFARGSYKGRFVESVIDINGFNTPPNTYGRDIFFFDIDNNGKMIAHGGKAYAFVRNINNTPWDASGGSYQCNKDKVSASGFGCAGSIMDNNLKVIYR